MQEPRHKTGMFIICLYTPVHRHDRLFHYFTFHNPYSLVPPVLPGWLSPIRGQISR